MRDSRFSALDRRGIVIQKSSSPVVIYPKGGVLRRREAPSWHIARKWGDEKRNDAKDAITLKNATPEMYNVQEKKRTYSGNESFLHRIEHGEMIII